MKYREAQCEFSASLSGGGAGNAHEMGRLACIAELNTRRVEQLRNAVSGLPLK
ncbi:lysozyme inhibitor LprI family protein [Burkholderia ubonensis]|uniref:lysozyme inhibitor LprI family protein n=1 Tax=Burkholderia ubonensis TaxID=101571 RepID=UPI001E36984C|nr:lysozyme inhibitor LprI family protein [Burkholderia ubonensis]